MVHRLRHAWRQITPITPIVPSGVSVSFRAHFRLRRKLRPVGGSAACALRRTPTGCAFSMVRRLRRSFVLAFTMVRRLRRLPQITFRMISGQREQWTRAWTAKSNKFYPYISLSIIFYNYLLSILSILSSSSISYSSLISHLFTSLISYSSLPYSSYPNPAS
jgi:hypothetical protein